MIQRYILTGAPGAGKTAILEGLRARATPSWKRPPIR